MVGTDPPEHKSPPLIEAKGRFRYGYRNSSSMITWLTKPRYMLRVIPTIVFVTARGMVKFVVFNAVRALSAIGSTIKQMGKSMMAGIHDAWIDLIFNINNPRFFLDYSLNMLH